MIFFKGLQDIFYSLLLVLFISSCEKVDVEFGESVLEADPNITFLDNYKVDIATVKVDSFVTSANEILSLGYHNDPVFGIVKAGSYVQLKLPDVNPLLNQTLAVTFDSLELLIRPKGTFYGDSARPFKINVYQLNQNIATSSNTDTYYNTSSFPYNSTAIGEQTVSLYGKSGTLLHIRLSDILGQELLTKFKDNHDDISNEEHFINYFKGIYITTDSVVTNSLAYFSAPADSIIVRLTYHDNGLYPEKKYIDFNYTKARQFNNLAFRHISSNFAAFISKKMQVIPSALSGNQSYVNGNLGAYVKMSFPTILNLKELHPYIRIVKAELIIKPDAASFVQPYQLPKTLNIYTTNEDNYPIASFYENTSDNPPEQNGNLSIDYLYGENTHYSYDISAYLNALINEGQFSKSAILLYPAINRFGSGIERLILNDQSNSRSSVQLKLYVLGL